MEIALGAANERPPSLPVDQSETRTGSILMLEGCGRQGMWSGGWHSGLEPAISTVLWSNLESKTSLYQIWEHVFVIILAAQKVWSVPILIMAIICHPVTRRNNNLLESGENSRPNYRSLNIFLTGKYEAGETLLNCIHHSTIRINGAIVSGCFRRDRVVNINFLGLFLSKSTHWSDSVNSKMSHEVIISRIQAITEYHWYFSPSLELWNGSYSVSVAWSKVLRLRGNVDMTTSKFPAKLTLCSYLLIFRGRAQQAQTICSIKINSTTFISFGQKERLQPHCAWEQ